MATTPGSIIDPPPNSTAGDGPQRIRKIQCEFCECDLGTSGEYKKLSDKAKGFRKAEETIEELNKQLALVRTENSELKARLAPVATGGTEDQPRGIRF